MAQTRNVLSLILVLSCLELAALPAICETDHTIQLPDVDHGEQTTSISNSLAIAAVSNALAVASAIIDERCLFYCAFERAFPEAPRTNRFLRFGMGDEAVRSLVDQVYDAFDSEYREDIVETMRSELECLVNRTHSAWVCPRRSRAEILARLDPKQMLDWFAFSSNRKALFYKLLEEKIVAQKERFEKQRKDTNR